MNYKSFILKDWIGHISGVIEDESTLDGNEMRDLVEFLSALEQEPTKKETITYLDGFADGLNMANNSTNKMLDKIRAEIEKAVWEDVIVGLDETDEIRIPRLEPDDVFEILDKYKGESEDKE